jgi:hypothetical protein
MSKSKQLIANAGSHWNTRVKQGRVWLVPGWETAGLGGFSDGNGNIHDSAKCVMISFHVIF